MKKLRVTGILSLILLFALVLSVAAYGSGSGDAAEAAPAESSDEASNEASTETSDEASTEASNEASAEASAEASNEASTEASAEASNEASGESAADSEPAELTIGLKGVKNDRQLGGYPTEDGRKVKENVLIRSGTLTNATAEDIALLTDVFNVKLIVDFRNETDIARNPDPSFNDAYYINIPVWDESLNAISLTDFFAMQSEYASQPGMSDLEMYRRGLMGADEDLYIKQTFQNDYSLNGYREFLDLLLAQEEGTGIVFHCTSGKDRTGSAAVILLTLLGVDRETVLADYALTNEVLKSTLDQKVAQSAQYTDDEEELYAVRTINGVNPEYMAHMFDYAEEQSGSMLEYIKEQFHVTDEEIQILRDKYLD